MAERRPLPPAASGVTIDRGVVPPGAATEPPIAQAPPETPNGAGASDNTSEAELAREDHPQGRTGGTAAKRPPTRKETGQSDGFARTARTVSRRPATPPEPQTSISPDEERRWFAWLGASAGKAAASTKRAVEDVDEFERTVQAARAAGMPERRILGAVARYDVEIPEPEPDTDGE